MSETGNGTPLYSSEVGVQNQTVVKGAVARADGDVDDSGGDICHRFAAIGRIAFSLFPAVTFSHRVRIKIYRLIHRELV